MICEGLPLGATGFGVAASALERVCDGRPEQDTEVWARLFLDDPRFVCRTLPEPNPAYARPDIRMTLDYDEDYRFFVAVVDGLRASGRAADVCRDHVVSGGASRGDRDQPGGAAEI